MRFWAFIAVPVVLSAAEVQFREHVIDAKFPRGYALVIVDLNRDGRPDILPIASGGTVVTWYENPSWTRHVMLEGITGLVNAAAHDIDGDGIPEVAIETEFSMIAAKSPGLVWILRHDGDVNKLWKATKIDALITSHHVGWADIDGDGKKELINAPLIGAKALAPKYEDHVSLVYYRTGDWKRHVIDDKIFGVLHRLRPVQWDGDKREELLTASFDGIKVHKAIGKGESLKWDNKSLARGHEEAAPRAGSSDVRMGRWKKRRFLASVEPWHGNEVVVYSENGAAWQRKVIFSQLVEGHEVVVADFNGDGLDDVAAGDRGKAGANVHVFYAQDDRGAEWHHQVIDKGGMAGSGCASADINADKRPDIVCIGASTGNIKWYENLGK